MHGTIVEIILSTALLALAAYGLVTGRVPGGPRRTHLKVYDRRDEPLPYYGFVAVYLAVGLYGLIAWLGGRG